MTTPSTGPASTPLTPVSIGPRGRFLWHELMTTAPDAAKPFYEAVAGWTAQDTEILGSYYGLFSAGEAMRAGMMRLPPEAVTNGARPHWVCYIGTPDVDATYVQALDLGASSFVKPMDVPDTGRIAVLADPQGAIFAIYTPLEAVDYPDPAPLGDFSWHELTSPNWERAFDFYATLFGWEKTEALDMGEYGVYQMFGHHGRTLGGMMTKMPGTPTPTGWLPYAFVADAKASAEAASAHGGTVVNGPMQVPGGSWITAMLDPQGALFAVNSL